MRTILLLLLAMPILGRAQTPTAADSALVGQFSDAARLDLAAEIAFGMFDQLGGLEGGAFIQAMVGDASPDAYVDSVQAAFYRDLRPAALADAVEAYRSPQFEALLDFERTMGVALQSRMAEMESVLADPDAYDLADRTLVADYLASTRQTDQFIDMMAEMMRGMMATFPGAEEEAAAMGMTVDEMVDEMLESDLRPTIDSTFLTATRYTLREVPEDEIRFVTAFYESESGTYVLDTMWDGGFAAMKPMLDRMVEFIATLFQSAPSVTTCEKGTPGCEPSPHAPPPPLMVEPPPPPPPPCPAGEDCQWKRLERPSE